MSIFFSSDVQKAVLYVEYIQLTRQRSGKRDSLPAAIKSKHESFFIFTVLPHIWVQNSTCHSSLFLPLF